MWYTVYTWYKRNYTRNYTWQVGQADLGKLPNGVFLLPGLVRVQLAGSWGVESGWQGFGILLLGSDLWCRLKTGLPLI